MNSFNKMQARVLEMAVVILIACLAACTGHQGQRNPDYHFGQPAVDIWVEDILVPYLAQQFSQHPRFKGQPVLLVRMQGDNVVPRIDELTEKIRAKITDVLLKENGLNLAWRPQINTWHHHQSLQEISCGDDRRVRYYIGIDTGLSKVNRKLYIKVKALNLSEHKWVSGFGKSWEGIPTPDQLDALGRENPDEYLLGMRPRPFTDRQPDLLAAYLARNLSCLLRQSESDDLILHVPSPAPDSPPMIKTAVTLLGRYLTRFREVEVTDDPKQANVSVISAIHSIDKELHQVWISLRQKKGAIYLPGAETEAYVIFQSHNETLIADKKQVKPSPSLKPYGSALDGSRIISAFDLFTPIDKRYCATETPWDSGVERVTPDGLLLTGSCLAVEMEVTKPAHVFLLAQDATGELSRMYPSSCPALGPAVAQIHPGNRFRFPSLSDSQSAALELRGSPGTERIYGLAIAAPELAIIFNDRMQELQDLCRPGRKYPPILMAPKHQYPQERIRRWQNYLKWLADKNSGLVEWREIRFRHKGAD